MLATNTMRYGFDGFSFNKSGLITAKQPWDCTAVSEVNGFTITKAIPANCDIRIAFAIDSKIQKLSATGTLTDLLTQSYTTDSILSEGNTVAELEALTSIPVFVGKSITPIIAMIAPPDAEVLPSIKLALKTKSKQDQYTKVEQSSEYVLAAEDVDIVDASAVIDATAGGSVLVEASIYTGGAWSDWQAVQAVKGKKASKIKYRATYAVTALGISSAKVTRTAVTYKTNNANVSGLTAELITTTKDLGGKMRYIRALVKHDRLKDSTIKTYVSFRGAPKNRDKYPIGSGTGERQTINLPDSGINHNTLQLFTASRQLYDFDYNLETNQVMIIADKDTSIYASYGYDWGKEDWREMQAGTTQPYVDTPNLYSTNYSYALVDGENAKGIASIKIVLAKTEGKVTDELIGTGTGGQQMFVLSHIAKADTLAIPGASFSLDDNNILTVVAPKGQQLKVSYDWISETPILRGYFVAWNE